MTKVIAEFDQRKKSLTDQLKARAAFDREIEERARAQENEEQRRAAMNDAPNDDGGDEDIGDGGGGDVVVIEDAESAMELEPMEVEPVDKDNDADDEGCVVVEEVKASAPESNKKKKEKKKKKTEQKPATFPVSADDEKEL